MDRFEKEIGDAQCFTLTTGGFRFETGDDGAMRIEPMDDAARAALVDVSRLNPGPWVGFEIDENDEVWVEDVDSEGWGVVVDRFFDAVWNAASGERTARDLVGAVLVKEPFHVVDVSGVSGDHRLIARGDEIDEDFDGLLDPETAEACVAVLNAAENHGVLGGFATYVRHAVQALDRLEGMLPTDRERLLIDSPSALGELAAVAGSLTFALDHAATSKAIVAGQLRKLLDGAER